MFFWPEGLLLERRLLSVTDHKSFSVISLYAELGVENWFLNWTCPFRLLVGATLEAEKEPL